VSFSNRNCDRPVSTLGSWRNSTSNVNDVCPGVGMVRAAAQNVAGTSVVVVSGDDVNAPEVT
jgi:hypothetical protein